MLSDTEILIGDGIAPDGTKATFYVDKQVLYDLMDDGPQWKYEACRFLIEAVASPDAIFEVRSKIGLVDRFCYSMRPTYDPDEPESETLPRYGFAFLVHIKRISGEYLAYNWMWREEDAENPGHPNDREALGRQLWPLT